MQHGFGGLALPDGYSTIQEEGSSLPQRRILNFVGASVTVTDGGDKTIVTVVNPTAYDLVQDEGTPLTQRTTMNFVGAGVTAADSGGVTTITIPGGLSTAYQTVQDEGTPLTQRDTINFVGGGVTATDSGGLTLVTIPTQQAYSTVEEEGAPLTQRTTMNFVGANVTVTDAGGKTVVTIDGVPSTRSISTVAPLSGGGDLSADRTITTSMATNRLIGRTSVGAGVMEEITPGANLTLAGGSLDVSGVPTNSRAINTTAPLSGGGDLSADRTITTSMATNKLIGRGTAGVGVMEEITLGTNLSFSGTTLNAAGGAGATWTETEIDFGTTPTTEKVTTIVDAGVSPASKILCVPSGNVGTDRVGDDWAWDSVVFTGLAGTGEFTLTARASGSVGGKRKLYYSVA